MIAPVIPGLTEHEIPSILEASAAAGARQAGYILLRLPGPVAELFEDWLDRHRPEAKEKVLGRIRAMRSGRLNDARFGIRMRGEGPAADLIRQLFYVSSRRLGLNKAPWPVSTAAFRRPTIAARERQLGLFDLLDHQPQGGKTARFRRRRDLYGPGRIRGPVSVTSRPLPG
jgi:DNA repair photolyase